MEIRESFKKKDIAVGIKGLDTMVGFIVDLAEERGEDKKTPICMTIDKSREAWKDVGEMIKILKNPDTTLKMDGRRFTFNGKDISEAGKWMADSYMK